MFIYDVLLPHSCKYSMLHVYWSAFSTDFVHFAELPASKNLLYDLYSGSLSYCFATVLCYEVTLFEEILAKLELCFCTPYTIPSSSTIYIYNIYRDHGTKHTYTWKDLLLGYNSTTLLLTTSQKSKVLILLDVLIFSYTSCAHYIWILL